MKSSWLRSAGQSLLFHAARPFRWSGSNLPGFAHGDEVFRLLPITRELSTHLPEIQSELADFLKHHDTCAPYSQVMDVTDVGLSGDNHSKWRFGALYISTQPMWGAEWFSRRLPAMVAHMPVLTGILDRLAERESLVVNLSILEPGPDLPWHQDPLSINRRVMFPLEVPDAAKCGRCFMSVETGPGTHRVEFPIEVGVPYLFDETRPHAVVNGLTSGSRVNLCINTLIRSNRGGLLAPLFDKVYQAAALLVGMWLTWASGRGGFAELRPRRDPLINQIIGPLKRPGWLLSLASFFFREAVFGPWRRRAVMAALKRAGLRCGERGMPSPEKADYYVGLLVMLHHSIRSGVYVASMLPELGLLHIRNWAEHLVATDVPGGFLEAGVWRGGSVIYMKHLSDVLSGGKRTVYALDSFEQMEDIADSGVEEDIECDKVCSLILNTARETLRGKELISTSVDEVRGNFHQILGARSTTNVKFLKGWFDDPNFPWEEVGQLSMLRLDCDYYKPTKVCLEQLYPKLSVGGVVILDEYYLEFMGEFVAVDEFRLARGISSFIHRIDHQSAYWIKTAE
jgi:hypothetical protein